jgi:chitinase
MQKQIPGNKIIVGKPATKKDVANTGFVNITDLGNWVNEAYKEFGWYGGVMLWQYGNDNSGSIIRAAAQQLI